MSNPQLLSRIFKSLDMLVLSREIGTEYYRILSHTPQWFEYFAPPISSKGIKLEGLFIFLDSFLLEAHEYWESEVDTPLSSGSWIELNELGEEFPLEATALWQDGQQLIILKDLGADYYSEVIKLQGFREHSLSEERLQLEVATRTQLIRKREEEIAVKLLAAAGKRDDETATHVRRIGLYAEVMAKSLDWSFNKVADIRIAAPMHDLGKIGIPDNILLKPGKLTPEEFNVMKGHAKIGADMLGDTNIPLLKMAAEIALCHHEKWDGSGYPNGLKGRDIPEAARITAIVDVYDALVHKRVYKEAHPESEAIKYMKSMSGKHFDPALLKIFIENLPQMRQIRESYAESPLGEEIA